MCRVNPCQQCWKNPAGFPNGHSSYYCDECYNDLVKVVEKLKAEGVLCCSILDPGPLGEPGLPGEPEEIKNGSM